jgi:peptidyl-prolyl cis-trans isomerase C
VTVQSTASPHFDTQADPGGPVIQNHTSEKAMMMMQSLQRASWRMSLLASMLCLAGTVRAADAPGPATVVARQGGATVSIGEIDAFGERIPAERRAAFFNSQQRIAMTINTILLQKQLAAIARSQGLDKGMEGPVTDQALADAEVAHFKQTLQVPDLSELARERYIANPEKFDIPETLDVQHILITSTVRSEAEAKALAATIEAQARKSPGDFDALVEKYSDDPDKSKDRGLVKNAGGKHVVGFAEAAQALAQPGDVSPVVETNVGYQILKLVAKQPKRRQSFDEVRQKMLADMKNEFVARAVKNQADQLRNQPVDVDSDLVDAILKRYAAALPTAPKPAAPSSGKAQ